MDKMIMKQLDRIEKSPGVYIFRNRENKIIYIGKAKNLRERVKSYFIGSRDNRPLIPRITDETAKIRTIKTDSEVEAILLEARLIKKNQPPYNARQKDDKSFIYIFINFSDPVPRVQYVRQREVLHSVIPAKATYNPAGCYVAKAGIQKTNRFRILSRPDLASTDKSGMTIRQKDKLFGPFLSAIEIRKLLNCFRLVIPFRDCTDVKFRKYQKLNRGCQWTELGKCSAPCVNQKDIKEYRQNIARLCRLLSGKVGRVKKDFVREMKVCSREKDYEQAAIIRDKIKTLDHIKQISMIDDDLHIPPYTSGVYDRMCKSFMVEAVDISNISGEYASGAVVAAEYQISNKKSKIKSQITNIKFIKNKYRRFKIKMKSKPNDVGMMREVIKRRLNHPEWRFPDLLIIDGGLGQLRAVESEVANSSRPLAAASNSKKINLVAIAKGPTRQGEKIFFSQNFDSKLKSTLIKNKRVIKLMRDEAHRFAISYHKILRRKGIIGK